ncbi:MAG: ABC transporter ATP-binding protein [Rhodospirillales bacterium]|nr:ABC transporter ATP-binding protein [Rhodospirillales bacterium]
MLLKVEDLRTHYKLPDGRAVRSVDGVSLDVAAGEIVAIVGESGCGKSTTALSILRLIRPPGHIASGRVVFNGVDLIGLPEERMRDIRGKDIGMVFQNPVTYLNPVERVGDQIAEAAILHLGLGRKEARAKVIEMLGQVRIPAPERVAQSYPHELSGGMNQRVLIAIAMICRPSLVILDEPTTALDVTIQREIINLIRDLKARLGVSMIFITHDFGLVAELADRVYIMYAGCVVEHGSVFDVFREPLHPYTQALLGAVLSINEYKETLVSIEGSVPDLKAPPSGCRFQSRCPRAMPKCAEAPLLKEHRQGHAAACWLYP